MAVKNKLKVAKQLMSTLAHDRDHRLLKIDAYEQGKQQLPYTPEQADEEYVALTERAITNVIPFMISTPAQMMFVDSFRPGRDGTTTADVSTSVTPEWVHWQKSRLDSRQGSVVRGALKFGHSFVVTEMDDKKGVPISRGLSALTTVALYEDAANDDDPYAALHVKRWASKENGAEPAEKGLAYMWDDTYKYEVTFLSLEDTKAIVVKRLKAHGANVCPVTRFAAAVDLEGRTVGVVEPMFVIQDRINQTVFDLLIVQSFASFKVRTIAGMTPPIKMKPIDDEGNEITDAKVDDPRIVEWIPVLDANGRPIPDEINLNAKRLFFAKDPQTNFSTLDETPLDGFIAAIDLAFKHMAALTQTPPHYLLGDITNLSADALEAAESSLARKVDEFKAQFGESWERVFRVAAEIGGYEGSDDYSGEVIWRDMGNSSLAQSADALGKMSESLGVPKRGLWRRIPNVTANELAEWNELYKEEAPDMALASSARRSTAATGATRPGFRLSSTEGQEAPAA